MQFIVGGSQGEIIATDGIVECVMINPQTGKEEKYRSLYVARDLANVDLQMVDVYISKENPAIYYVDVEGTMDAIK